MHVCLSYMKKILKKVGGSMGGGDPESTTTETNPWAPTMGHGKDILALAQQLFQQQGGIGGNWIDFNAPQANENLTGAWDKLAQSGALTGAGDALTNLGSQMTGAFDSALDSFKKASQDITTYDIQSTRDTFLKDKEKFLAENDAAIQKQLNKSISQSTGQIYGGAAGGGNVGSSRTQLAVGQASGDLASNAQSLMAQQRSQAYDQAMAQANTQLTGNRQAQLAAAQQGFGVVNQGMNAITQGANMHQQAINNQLNAGLQQYNYQMQMAQIQYQNLMGQQNAGWQNLGLYNSVVGGWAGAGGTSTSTANGGGGGNMFGGIGSAIGSIWGPVGTAVGGAIGGVVDGAVA